MNLLTKNNPSNLAEPHRTVTPRYDVRETADAFIVTAHVPGVERSAVETHLDGETLSISARRNWTPPADWMPVYQESIPADYRLELELDRRMNRDAVRAELNQGVLTLTLPKAETLKPRKIEIQG